MIGSDGNVWYGSRQNGTVGRIKFADLSVTSFTLPSSMPSGANPAQLTLGADGKIWFSENADNQIGRIGVDGTIAEFNIPTPNTAPEGICLGPDGNVWFVEVAGHGVVHLPNGSEAGIGGLGRITPAGQITEYSLPPATSGIGIAAGPDGNLWIADGPQIIRFRMK
jgi:virginiamycin B lyase